jgi:hypothetical protein
MSDTLETKRFAYEFRGNEKTRRQRSVIRTTLGDLIVAVMDEVTSFVRDPSGRRLVTACVLNDLLNHHQQRILKRSRRRQ